MDEEPGRERPLMALEAEDQEFVVRLVLASGSLKEVAAHYGVSYPTIRGRMDRIIERLKRVLSGRKLDPLAEYLSAQVERGQMTAVAARRVLSIHRDCLEKRGGGDR